MPVGTILPQLRLEWEDADRDVESSTWSSDTVATRKDVSFGCRTAMSVAAAAGSENTTAILRPFLGPSVESCSASRGHHMEGKWSDLITSIRPSPLSIRATLHLESHLSITMYLELITEFAMTFLFRCESFPGLSSHARANFATSCEFMSSATLTAAASHTAHISSPGIPPCAKALSTFATLRNVDGILRPSFLHAQSVILRSFHFSFEAVFQPQPRGAPELIPKPST